MVTQIETERRFLVGEIPGVSSWPVPFEISRIKQVYLHTSDGTVERIRQRTWRQGGRELTHTIKVPLGPGSNRETEGGITQDQFDLLIRGADQTREPLLKARTVFKYGGWTWELDEIFNCGLNILEVELPTLDVELELPPWLTIIREITGESGYSNFELAKSSPNVSIGANR